MGGPLPVHLLDIQGGDLVAAGGDDPALAVRLGQPGLLEHVPRLADDEVWQHGCYRLAFALRLHPYNKGGAK